MLTTKQIARNTFVTYCSTQNAFFAHCKKTQPKSVNAVTCAIAKHATQQQLQNFFALPALYSLYNAAHKNCLNALTKNTKFI